MVRFNGFVVRFSLVQVSKIVNGSVWSLSNRIEPLPIVSLGADNPMIVDARYPYYDSIDARPVVSSCFEPRSGELGPSSFG